MIPHRLSCFGDETLVPIIGVQPVTDFDFIGFVDNLVKETAVPDQLAAGSNDSCELRR